jgi:DNA end-binding protein Ku
MTVDFDPSQYTDQYRDALEELVEAKIAGHEVAPPPPPVEKPVTSLADALRASLAAASGGTGGSGTGGGRQGQVSAARKRPPRRTA